MELKTAREAAPLLGVSHQTIINWLNKGLFPNAFQIEGTIRIPLNDIEALKTQKKAAQ